MATTFDGTLAYWPPERFEPEYDKFDVRADIWSFGITLVEIVLGRLPYQDKNGRAPNNIILLQHLILHLQTEGLIEKTFSQSDFSCDIREFVGLCLRQVLQRPKIDRLKETRFFKTYASKSQEERNTIVADWLKPLDVEALEW